tara:strand:+ start:8324 stop:9568 length:1245 start_codon:yes stop_codon:yes gene_type:complete
MKNNIISIIGLGYVGLPLAKEFSSKFHTIGYDINKNKINKLKKNKNYKKIFFTNSLKNIKKSNIKIICVPTPVNANKKPNLSLLKKASSNVGRFLNNKDIIIFESTVYPGVTEEICIPILEKSSKMKSIEDKYSNGFFYGYSPERINPGDTKHSISKVIKVVSGNCSHSLKMISKIYSSIIKAGIYKAKNIKTAEAAKIIENVQRDVNIALINELALLFNKMNINTNDVLEAASTKWNFSNYSPGLVGGHCIGVDPYYLSFKARELKFHPLMIESGRKINDNMAIEISRVFLKSLNNNIGNKKIRNILIMGLAFKENCEDLRNSKVYDMYIYLTKKHIKVDIFDPVVDKKEAKLIYDINLLHSFPNKIYDGVIICVKHNVFHKLGAKKINEIVRKKGVILDLKNLFPNEDYLRI